MLFRSAVLSDGTKVKNPRFYKKEQEKLAKAQRRASNLKKGSKERKRANKAVAKVHERIKNKRHNFVHQESRKLVDSYDILVVEDLNVSNMLEQRNYSKSISDASWSTFIHCLSYKAVNAGKKVINVDPAYTSQTCSGCGHKKKMPVKERTYTCGKCGLTLDRDLNASFNILSVGTHTLTNLVVNTRGQEDAGLVPA